MKGTTEERKALHRGSIVQFVKDSDVGTPFGFAMVESVESWGCKVHLPDGVFPAAWIKIEPTGGVALFDPSGEPVPGATKPERHHP